MYMREIPKRETWEKLSVAILCLFASACVGTALPPHRPYSQIPIEQDLHKHVAVTANGPWQDSGVMLQTGDEFFIDAKGTWSGGLGWESGPKGAVGPDVGRIYPAEPAATALIGKIGSGSPFTVGDQYLGKASQNGNLFLRMNDPTTWDNSGQLTVDIYVQSKGKGLVPMMGASLPKSENKDAKDLPKIAVWDLAARNTPITHAQELTSILVSEITKIRKYEVYSQENVRTLAGWTEERMKLGCTSTQCLTALGQMDIAKLVSGSVGKIGDTYSISLNLFDTQNARAENAISEFCRTESELIGLLQQTVRKLLGQSATLSSPPASLSSEEVIPTLKAVIKAYNDRDIERHLGYFTADAQIYSPFAKDVMSRKNYEDLLLTARSLFPADLRKIEITMLPSGRCRAEGDMFLYISGSINIRRVIYELIPREGKWLIIGQQFK